MRTASPTTLRRCSRLCCAPAATHETSGRVLVSAFGPLLTLSDRPAGHRLREQSCVRAASGASLRRSTLRADSPPMLGLAARRRTHSVRCAHCVQTMAPSQSLMRAARAAASPALLGASQARLQLPARSFAATAEVFATNTQARGLRGRGCPAGAIWVATSSAGPGSARASAHPHLTRRGCLNAVSAANEVSSAARPRTEQRSAVGAQRRPPPYEPPSGCPCRDAPNPRKSDGSRTSATGRQLILPAPTHSAFRADCAYPCRCNCTARCSTFSSTFSSTSRSDGSSASSR